MNDKKLWRYCDLIKFLTLVNGELYFARADKFKDKYEGAIPNRNFLEFVELMGYGRDDLEKREVRQELRQKFHEKKKKAAISCWHLNEGESAAMWDIYSQAGRGIAVSTTVSRLSKLEKPDCFELEMFEVEYIDFAEKYDSDYIYHELLPFKNKRKEFEYEQEFRLMLFQPINGSVSKLNDMPPDGIKISVNASDLIEEIIASPYMEDYEITEIQRVLDMVNKEKGTNFTIKRSVLYDSF